MSRPMVRIHNTETNEIIDRQMNDEEFAEWEIDVAAEQQRVAKLEAEAEERQALLDKLGITEDEAKLLLGGN